MDRVLPAAPYRQLVLSLPYKLRIHLARDPRFLSAMLGGYLKCVFAWQRHRGRVAGIDDGQTGAISFVQRFGAALNLNVHFHSLTPDELFVPNARGTLSFTPLDPPSNEDVARLGRRVFRRLTKIASRHLSHHKDDGDKSQDDDVNASAHCCDATPKLEETQSGEQIVLPLGEFDAPLDSGNLSTAGNLRSVDEPVVTDDALSDQPKVRLRRMTWARLLKRSLGV